MSRGFMTLTLHEPPVYYRKNSAGSFCKAVQYCSSFSQVSTSSAVPAAWQLSSFEQFLEGRNIYLENMMASFVFEKFKRYALDMWPAAVAAVSIAGLVLIAMNAPR